MRRLPIVPTLVVLVAAALMVKLGLWQLQRAQWKEALLARYEAAAKLPPIAYPLVPTGEDLLFRHASGFCLEPTSWRVEPGRSAGGASGWRHIAACRTGAEGPGLTVDAGWSADFQTQPSWKGGPVSGVVAAQPDHRSLIEVASGKGVAPGAMIVAATPAPGLQPSAPPDIADIPNNHRAYAVQWFIFAALAVLIYALALAKRLRSQR